MSRERRSLSGFDIVVVWDDAYVLLVWGYTYVGLCRCDVRKDDAGCAIVRDTTKMITRQQNGPERPRAYLAFADCRRDCGERRDA